MVMQPDAAFWRGRRVLLTGHTGFKGAWLALWLHRLGARVTGIALAPQTQPNLFDLAGIGRLVDSRLGDIRDAATVAAVVRDSQPEVVLHLAAQALVRPSYADPIQTFSTNVMGTAQLLEALRLQGGARVVLVATTDKVYRNRESGQAFVEDDELGGHDPYSASKAAAEMVLASYRDAFLASAGTAVASVRAGNVIGGGDWSPERLLPDAMTAWSTQQTLQVRRPDAVRPWQHVLEPLAAYLLLAQRLWHVPALAGAYNSGPDPLQCGSVSTLLALAQQAYGGGRVAVVQPCAPLHEAANLRLDSSKIRSVLGVQPIWSLEQAVSRSVAWYRSASQGMPAQQLCADDIVAFETTACPS